MFVVALMGLISLGALLGGAVLLIGSLLSSPGALLMDRAGAAVLGAGLMLFGACGNLLALGVVSA